VSAAGDAESLGRTARDGAGEVAGLGRQPLVRGDSLPGMVKHEAATTGDAKASGRAEGDGACDRLDHEGSVYVHGDLLLGMIEHGVVTAGVDRSAAAVAVPSRRARRRASALAGLPLAAAVPEGLPLAAPGADGSLHMAAHVGSMGFVRLLLGLGVDVNAGDGCGATPLHYAAGSGHVEIVGELLRAAADVQACDCRQQTPLHYAAISPSARAARAARVLMVHGADPKAMDALYNTPLSIALQVKNHEVALAMVQPRSPRKRACKGHARKEAVHA